MRHDFAPASRFALPGWMKWPASINGRLTLTFALTAAIVFMTAGLSIVAFQVSELRRYQASDLRSRMDIVEALVVHTDDPLQFRALGERLRAFTPTDDGLRFIIRSGDPAYRYGRDWPAGSWRGAGAENAYCMHFDGRVFMAYDRVAPARGARPAVTMTVAVDFAPIKRTSLMLGLGVLLVSALGVAMVTLAASRVVRRGLRPVGWLSEHAARVTSEHRSQRLPLHELPCELEGLARSFNGALSRLEDAYSRLSAFNADVAHELRTPLGNLIGQTQVALSRERSRDDLKAVLQSNLEDLDRLRGIINDMLFLARADQGALAENVVVASLAALARKTGDFMEVLFEEAGMSLVVEGDAFAIVEPALFSRALTNLLDNALRYGQPGGCVTVEIGGACNRLDIAVRNRGAPIANEALRRIFDRFYRADPSRVRAGEGHGLGLAIVKAVASMHQGTVFARWEAGEVVVGFSVARAACSPTTIDPDPPAPERVPLAAE